MTNTQRLIASLDHAIMYGIPHIDFMVGRYTGNGPTVVAALRRQGYKVTKVPSGRVSTYRLEAAEWAIAELICGIFDDKSKTVL